MSLIREVVQKEFNPSWVDIVEFAEGLCDKPLYPRQQVLLKLIFLEEMEGWEEDILQRWIDDIDEVKISPFIRERRDYCRERGYDHFSEIDLIGGRRSSKGHVTGLAGGYKLYRVRQIPDPGAFYGLDVDKQIYFSCIASALHQAKKFQFADLYSVITRCTELAPYITKGQEESISIRTDSDDRYRLELERMGIPVTRDFTKLRVQPLAANEDSIRGATSIYAVFDEFAHMLGGESRSSDKQCWTALRPSLAQFGQHALIFCNSSPYQKLGQLFEQYELAMRPHDGPDAWYPMRMAVQFPTWALYQDWWKTTHWKRPLYVSPDWPDQIDPDVPESKLSLFSLEQREQERLEEIANPETYAVEARAQWAEVIDAYLNTQSLDRSFSGIKPDGEPCLATSGGTYRYEYKMHCDPSSTTAGFGFAIGHVEEFPDPTGLFPDSVARHVVFDKVWRWNPKDFGGTINYIKVREELEHWIDVYRPSELSFDQFNSVAIAQELREFCRRSGINETRVVEISATNKSNWDGWEAFKTALNLGLVHFPINCVDDVTGFDHSEWALWELQRLQCKPAGQYFRVDKQSTGPVQTKDTADCIMYVTYKFLSSYLGHFTKKSLEQKLQYGAQGGYPIGGRHEGGPMSGNREEGSTAFDQFYNWKSSNLNPARTRGVASPRRRR